MDNAPNSFKTLVYEYVAQVPPGKVVTYGQIAAYCGKPRAARIVGGVAHYGDPALPWQRVVKVDGSLAEGFYGGITGHEEALRAEGVTIVGGKVDMKKHLWKNHE
jgi:methylated-DNA-protein-cysteine methyltransferase-like protein